MSILTNIGQGDRYFEKKLMERYGLDLGKVCQNEDGTIDYDGDVDFTDQEFEYLPFRFREVSGDFRCFRCENLLSLDGCPKKVGGTFDCRNCGILFFIGDIVERCEVGGMIYL